MIKFNQISVFLVILLRNSLCIEIKNGTAPLVSSTTTLHYLENESILTTKMPSIEKSDLINLSKNHHHHNKKNSSLNVAESRLFPVGHPGLIPQPGSLVSPFDVATFSNSLLPLISAGIKEKVKDIATAFNDGFDYVEDSIREGWRESPLNPHNYEKYLNNPPNLFEHLPHLGNHIVPHYPHPAYHKHPKASHKPTKGKVQTNHPIESYSSDEMMHEFGINGYKHFEESILREIEKQEELKVEATIHTLFGKDEKIEIVRGRPYESKLAGWKPVAAPTKIYDDSNEITSQIISPLHSSFIHASDAIGSDFDDKKAPLGFHDFDNFHNDFIHSSYGIEESGESKVKPVKAKITPVRRITPVPPIYSTVATTSATTKRYSSSSTTLRSRSTTTASSNNNRKRQSISTEKPIVDEKSNKVSDTSTSASNAVPVIVSANIKRHPSRIHIQSLTTSKPKNHSNIVRSPTTDSSAENSSKELSFESTSRFRIPTSSIVTRTSRTTTTTSTTRKPSKNVPRETSKFVDRARSSGYRGSVKYNQSSTKQADAALKK